jgi:hypothetical protein
VCKPWLRAFVLPGSAPDAAPPPCIRHRIPPLTAIRFNSNRLVGDRFFQSRKKTVPL